MFLRDTRKKAKLPLIARRGYVEIARSSHLLTDLRLFSV